uniref:Uncharacterized protein n=1 Tax=Cyanistes caeruleus TaxID=156563 RepID=A0A8C0VCN7_CYACU
MLGKGAGPALARWGAELCLCSRGQPGCHGVPKPGCHSVPKAWVSRWPNGLGVTVSQSLGVTVAQSLGVTVAQWPGCHGVPLSGCHGVPMSGCHGGPVPAGCAAVGLPMSLRFPWHPRSCPRGQRPGLGTQDSGRDCQDRNRGQLSEGWHGGCQDRNRSDES